MEHTEEVPKVSRKDRARIFIWKFRIFARFKALTASLALLKDAVERLAHWLEHVSFCHECGTMVQANHRSITAFDPQGNPASASTSQKIYVCRWCVADFKRKYTVRTMRPESVAKGV